MVGFLVPLAFILFASFTTVVVRQNNLNNKQQLRILTLEAAVTTLSNAGSSDHPSDTLIPPEQGLLPPRPVEISPNSTNSTLADSSGPSSNETLATHYNWTLNVETRPYPLVICVNSGSNWLFQSQTAVVSGISVITILVLYRLISKRRPREQLQDPHMIGEDPLQAIRNFDVLSTIITTSPMDTSRTLLNDAHYPVSASGSQSDTYYTTGGSYSTSYSHETMGHALPSLDFSSAGFSEVCHVLDSPRNRTTTEDTADELSYLESTRIDSRPADSSTENPGLYSRASTPRVVASRYLLVNQRTLPECSPDTSNNSAERRPSTSATRLCPGPSTSRSESHDDSPSVSYQVPHSTTPNTPNVAADASSVSPNISPSHTPSLSAAQLVMGASRDTESPSASGSRTLSESPPELGTSQKSVLRWRPPTPYLTSGAKGKSGVRDGKRPSIPNDDSDTSLESLDPIPMVYPDDDDDNNDNNDNDAHQCGGPSTVLRSSIRSSGSRSLTMSDTSDTLNSVPNPDSESFSEIPSRSHKYDRRFDDETGSSIGDNLSARISPLNSPSPYGIHGRLMSIKADLASLLEHGRVQRVTQPIPRPSSTTHPEIQWQINRRTPTSASPAMDTASHNTTTSENKNAKTAKEKLRKDIMAARVVRFASESRTPLGTRAGAVALPRRWESSKPERGMLDLGLRLEDYDDGLDLK